MNDIEKLKRIIDNSDNIVFFGGAGVSTESGIPDFRSKDGLYNQKDIKFDKYKPEYLLSKACLDRNPRVFFEFYRQKMDTRKIEPNITHYYLTELENRGKLKAIVTQNIDGLHQKAGSKHVIEIHGTAQVCHCKKCNTEYSCDYIFDNVDDIPRCSLCGKIVRPNIVLYGENLPGKACEDATRAITSADTLIVAGTSLTVYPAASFISEFQGDHLVIINRDPIHMPIFSDSDLQINDSLGAVFTEILKLDKNEVK